MVELAAGLVDGDETPEETILRESREEMGLEVESLEKIGDFLLTPGGCDELCSLFAGRVRLGAIGADGFIGSGGLASEHEDIRVRALPAEEVIAKALAGAIPIRWRASGCCGLRRGGSICELSGISKNVLF